MMSNMMVPTEGLEPPHLAAHGPEPCASTNSATWALLVLLIYCFRSALLRKNKIIAQNFFVSTGFCPDFLVNGFIGR